MPRNQRRGTAMRSAPPPAAPSRPATSQSHVPAHAPPAPSPVPMGTGMQQQQRQPGRPCLFLDGMGKKQLE